MRQTRKKNNQRKANQNSAITMGKRNAEFALNRALEKGIGISFSELEKIEEMYIESYRLSKGSVLTSVDHIIPISRGGRHALSNLKIRDRREDWAKGNNIH